jgi:hypothetical protein
VDFIYTRDNAIPDDLCDELVRRYEEHPDKRPGATGSGVDPARKHSLDLDMDQAPAFRQCGQRLVNILAGHFAEYFRIYPFFGSVNPVLMNPQSGEKLTITMDNREAVAPDVMRMLVSNYFHLGPLTMLRYTAGAGGYPHWHAENFPEPSAEAMHRALFFVCYLNDVESGGETEFFFYDTRVAPRRGRLLIAPCGFTHTHRGAVTLSGDKYIISSWLIFNRAGKLTASAA